VNGKDDMGDLGIDVKIVLKLILLEGIKDLVTRPHGRTLEKLSYKHVHESRFFTKYFYL
jgi:hypothetical protein